MEKQQTAVGYLYKIIHARIHIDKDLSEYLEQALEMEEQQKKDAYLEGIKNYDPTFKSE